MPALHTVRWWRWASSSRAAAAQKRRGGRLALSSSFMAASMLGRFMPSRVFR